MLLARKLKSAVRLYRRQGMTGVEELARINAAALYRSHRLVPADPARRVRLLSDMLNRWSGVSPVVVERQDGGEVRDALLVPYLRHRFAAAAAAAVSAGPPLRPIEIAVLADCLLTLWDYGRIDDCLPTWVDAVRGTRFAGRIDQVGRRTALRLGRLHDAARGLEPGGDVASLLLRGEVCDALGRMEDAEDAFAAALRRKGSDAYGRKSYAFHLLKAGRVLDGLSNWSIADGLAGDYPLRRHRPAWTGEPLGSRHIMVLFEHGLGDMIQMARFLAHLRAREPEAVISGRVPAPLLGLLARAFPSVRFITDDEREPDYDVFVPSMQLPAVLDVEDLEPRGRYLSLGPSVPLAKPGDAARRPKIGICWRGHPRQYELTRSIPLDLFSTLFDVASVDFVVLLNRLTAEEEALLRRNDRVAVPPIGDFLDLAAAVASCDLVVSVDTAVPHLAAAGGAPVLLLSRPDGCWRWGVSGPASPWYETVEVLRHRGDMDWPRMLAEVAERLRQLGRSASTADL